MATKGAPPPVSALPHPAAEPVACDGSSVSGHVQISTGRKSLKTSVVIVSDIHLGSEVCRAKALRKAIAEWYPFERLVILGDLFDDLNFSRLRKHHFGLIDDFRRLTKPSRGVTVDWIEGNHDEQAHDIIHRIIGANVYDELILEMNARKYLLIHGHQFDNFLVEYPRITMLAENIYGAVQRHEGEGKSLSRWLKRKSKGWLSVCRKVEERATGYARARGADVILCGHTHYHNAGPEAVDREIAYVNTGCWTDAPSTLTTIGAEGLHKHMYY